MKLGAFLKQYLKQSLQVFKHPKQMLPTIILTVVWIILGILQIKLKENLPMKLLNFLTYAQGGLYGGIFGAIGGILGKVVVAAFVNALIVPLFMGKKPFAAMEGGWKELLQNIGFQSKSALAPLLKGFGAAMLIYILFNTTARFENSMAGIMAAVSLALAMGKKSGFMWELAISYANSVSKGKKLNYQSILRALTGMTLGFALAVALTVVAPSLVSLLGIVALIVGWIMGKGSKKEAVSTMAMVLLCLLPQWEMKAQGDMDDLVNAFSKINPDAPTGAKGDASEGVWVLKDIKTEVKSEGTQQVWFTPTTVYNLQITDNTNISFDFREEKANGESGHCTSTISPVKGPYAPGEELCMGFSGSQEHPDITAFGHICTLWDNVHGIDNAIVKQAYCCLIFPHPDDVFADHFEFTFTVTICDAYVSMKYIFEWQEVAFVLNAPEWVKQVMGTDQEHANEAWTVFISLVGGFMGGGLLGGAGGAAAGGGGPFTDGPGPMTPEDERRRRFLTENGDGTRTMEDPATGKQYTLYPTYDEDGNQTGWKNENDTPYDEAGIDEWLDWRERNSSAFSQDEATAEKNLEDWRKRNEELKNKDREAYDKETEAIRAQRKREDYIEKMADEYYVGYNSSVDSKQRENDIKKEMIKEMQDAETESAQNTLEEYEASWNQAYMETYQKVCDTGVTIGAQVAPGGKAVQTYYSLAKNGLGRGMEARATGGSFVKGLAAGSVEGGLEVLQNNANVMGDAAGSKLVEYGTQVGAGVIKEAFTGWYEGKSVEETVKEMRNSAIGEAVKIGTGKLIEKGVKSVNAGYQGSGYVYGSMYREGVEGAITKNIELGQQLSETFNTGFDVTMTWIKD